MGRIRIAARPYLTGRAAPRDRGYFALLHFALNAIFLRKMVGVLRTLFLFETGKQGVFGCEGVQNSKDSAQLGCFGCAKLGCFWVAKDRCLAVGVIDCLASGGHFQCRYLRWSKTENPAADRLVIADLRVLGYCP